MSNDSYVYIIFRPTGIPCYVGQGRGSRWKRHKTRSHNPHLRAIYEKYGTDLPVVIINSGLSIDEAKSLEMIFINAIGREIDGGPLVNLTLGGDGSFGAKMSEEWRKNRSRKAKISWENTQFRENQIQRMLGNSYSKKPHILSDQWRNSLAEKMRGNTYTLGYQHTPEARKKMSVVRKGKEKSPEHRAAIGAAHRGKKRTAAQCKAISNSLIGRTLSAEQKKNIGAGLRKMFALRKKG